MEAKALPDEEAIKKAKASRRYLKFLFILSILGFLGSLNPEILERSLPAYLIDLCAGALGITFCYLLVKTCRIPFILAIIGLKFTAVSLTLLIIPLSQQECYQIGVLTFFFCILHLLAYISCRHIHKYLTPLAAPTKEPPPVPSPFKPKNFLSKIYL